MHKVFVVFDLKVVIIAKKVDVQNNILHTLHEILWGLDEYYSLYMPFYHQNGP